MAPAMAGNGHGNSSNHGQSQNHGNKSHSTDDNYSGNDITSQVCAGYKPLPPGVEKNLAKGKPLPPGIAKRNVPANLLQTLPHYSDQAWSLIGSDFVSVVAESGLIGDIIHNTCHQN